MPPPQASGATEISPTSAVAASSRRTQAQPATRPSSVATRTMPPRIRSAMSAAVVRAQPSRHRPASPMAYAALTSRTSAPTTASSSAAAAGSADTVLVMACNGTRMDVAIVVTGAPGSGKSSVLQALTTLLEVDGVEYGAIESEQLAWGSPWLDPAAMAAQLAVVARMQRDAGRRRFVVGATTETSGELDAILGAIAAERSFVACLSAPPDVVAARIDRREPDAWPGKHELIEHARVLALSIPAIAGLDAVVDTDGRDPADVAGEIMAALRARGLVD